MGFPNNFLWGASTSAFQVESAVNEDGKTDSIADVRSRKMSVASTDMASDEYHHLHEDIALMKELGLKAYRFSISWTRVLPNGDLSVINSKGLSYYQKMIKLLKDNQIEPIVTIYHFDYPMALIKKYKGWLDPNSINDYFNYAKFLIDQFHNQVKYWLTINEQEVQVFNPNMLGIYDNNASKLFEKAQTANLNMYLGQAKIIKYVRENYPNLKIGPAVSFPTYLPATMASEDAWAAKKQENIFAFSLMDIVIRGKIPKLYLNWLQKHNVHWNLTISDKKLLKQGKANYLGLNWYTTQRLTVVDHKVKEVKIKNAKYTEWGWAYDPVGLRFALNQIQERYSDIPVIITECGWSEREKLENGQVHDPDRINYLKDHLLQLNKALHDGVNVIGFCPWSFIDLLSSHEGMAKRYGLVYVNVNDRGKGDRKRIKKDSFDYYRKIIETNGQSLFESN